MVSTKASDLQFPHLGKPREMLFSLKLPTNLEVMQRFLHYFKYEKLSKQKSINRTCDEVILLWKKVADGSTPDCICYMTLHTVKAKMTQLWEEYRATQAWGERCLDKQTNASAYAAQYKEKLNTLFDIAKPDFEHKLCEEDWKFIQDQRNERHSTFGMRDTKLHACLERRKIRQEQKIQRAKIAQEEKKRTLELEMTSIADDEAGPSNVEIDDNFWDDPPKKTKKSEFILLDVPKDIASRSHVVMAADRHKMSNNVLNDIIASIIRESKGCVNDFTLSRMSTSRGRRKLRVMKFETLKKYISNDLGVNYFTIHWNEKLLKAGKAFNQQGHIAVLAGSARGEVVKLLGTTVLDSGTGLNLARAIKDMLEEWNSKEQCVAMCFDTTASNTGRFAGARILLEAFIGYPLLWTSCRHHMLEVILGDALKVIFGPTSSPMVNFFGILKSKWPTLNLSSITRINDSHLVGMEPVKIHRQTALQALQKLCSDSSTYLPRHDYEELLKLSLIHLDRAVLISLCFGVQALSILPTGCLHQFTHLNCIFCKVSWASTRIV